MASATKPNVFISYARHDRAFADLIRGYLIGRHDLGVTLDQAIAAGENWPEAMSAALDSSEVVILLVSPAFLSSQWNLYEAGVALAKARARQGRVVTVLVGDVDPSDLPASLRSVQMVDARGDDQRLVLGQLDEALSRAAA